MSGTVKHSSERDASPGTAGGPVGALMAEKILVVDDEKLIRWSLKESLERAGYQVAEAEDGEQAVRELDSEGADLVLLDIRMPGKTGLQVLEHIASRYPGTPAILMTAYSSVSGAVEAMRHGAFDYVVKPFDQEEVLVVVRKALDTTRLQREVQLLRRQAKERHGLANLVGESRQMHEVGELIGKVASSAASTVLIQGESGTGKDLAAKAIHYASERSDKPFMNITCSALPETLLESELMGHERGAFTDAREMKRGLFELAEGGTLFLDEIGDMGLGLQAKLLRFLEDKIVRRVGGTRDFRVNVRVIAATNRDLQRAVGEGRFREDLYYRLNVIRIRMPALRERPEDLPLLAAHFVDQFNREFRKRTRGFTSEAMQRMERYPWPGNVRELRNVVERAMILESKDYLGVEDLPGEIVQSVAAGSPAPAARGAGSEHPGSALPNGDLGLKEMEQEMLRRALARTAGNQTRAAALLDISRDALRYKMKKYRLL